MAGVRRSEGPEGRDCCILQKAHYVNNNFCYTSDYHVINIE